MPETCPTVYRGRSSSSNGNNGTVIHSLAQTTSKGCGPGAKDAPGPQGDALPSGSDLLLALGVDLDLAGLSGRQQRQADGQHAIGEVGLDLVEVDLVAKGEAPGEGAGNPFAGNQLLVLTSLLGTLRAHREHAAVHRDVDGLGVDAGQVEAEQDLVLAPDNVHRHGRPHPGGPVGRAEGAPGAAVELHEGVERCKQHWVSPPVTGCPRPRLQGSSQIYFRKPLIQLTYSLKREVPRRRLGRRVSAARPGWLRGAR